MLPPLEGSWLPILAAVYRQCQKPDNMRFWDLSPATSSSNSTMWSYHKITPFYLRRQPVNSQQVVNILVESFNQIDGGEDKESLNSGVGSAGPKAKK